MMSEKVLCADCVDDGYIRVHIRSEGVLGKQCSYCHREARTMTLMDLVSRCEDVFSNFYEGTADEDRVVHFNYPADGARIEDCLVDLLGDNSDLIEDLRIVLLTRLGGETLDEADPYYIQRSRLEGRIGAQWQRMSESLKYESRLVNPEAIKVLDVVFGGVGVFSGLAGTGKTTVSLIYADAFKAAGREVFGACVSNAAAEKLNEESGLPCTSVAKMVSDLKKGNLKLTERHVIVLDEAGMVDSAQTRDLMSFCAKAGSKLILQGDTEQLQPVGAGSGMGVAKDAIGDTKLTEIRRQKSAQDRHTAGLFYNYGADGKVTVSKTHALLST